MRRDMAGHGRLMTRLPPELGGTLLPFSSRMSASMPGNGMVAEPGLVAVMPGSGEIIIMPVSVCHQVSTIGQRSLPMCWLYQIHASGLIGSPTVPIRRSGERSYFDGHSVPQRMNVRIAVG